MAKHKILYIIFLMFLTFLGCSKAKQSEQPNVVIIFIDDMGYADPSCFGNPVVETPNIDALAGEGLKFTNFYVNSPICSPSRVALNTGTYPMRHRIHSYIASSEQNNNRAMADYLNPEVPFFAHKLKQNGYATGHFGKWHMGGGRDLGDVPHPSEYGYDKSLVSFEGIGDRVLFPNDNLCAQSAKLGRGNIIWAEKHRSTEIYVDSALAFIDRNPGKPFFVNLCPNDVHDPHLPDSAMWENYKAHSENPWEQKFFAVLRELDNQIGRFMSGLENRGLLGNTIVVFTSDNGPTDWPHYYNRQRYPAGYKGELYPPGFAGEFYGRKWSLYEGGIRMPFIIRWKGHTPVAVTDSTTVLAAMDLFPSLCSLLGIKYPENLDGTDKSEALLGTPVKVTQPLMWEYASNPGGSIQPGNKAFRSPNLAIRQGDWKLLINADSTDIKLFNLKKDPGEKLNLAAQNTELAGVMAGKVLAWRRSMPVDMPGNTGE
ncbi:Arylsulfatase A [Tangfeifania diversioriginum]|uniref:Arylsulfatase A n=1 Tax=Tangfeifania diversioriginum TaxID=1168035 RepID=A0A1M6MCD9_9BACT|nr:sulfatase-like hydrolase/transferase [Tangfeifania diversioriginum]SHJ81075.1 Arylsulfatase A [Tangfeifania diversioriginum]